MIEIKDFPLLHSNSAFDKIKPERRKRMENFLFLLKKYAKDIVFGILICISIAISSFCIYQNQDDTEIVENTNLMANITEEEEEEKNPSILHVDIKGAIKNPGVYEVEEGTIIEEVVNLAGGFKEDAVKDDINLSKKVSDEMVIYIYTEKESEKISPNTTSENKKTCYSNSYNIEDCINQSESIIVSGEENKEEGNQTSDSNNIININTANKEALMTLNGIGEVKADAIIAYRNQNGNFKSIEDILNVSGIGETVFAKIKDYITI